MHQNAPEWIRMHQDAPECTRTQQDALGYTRMRQNVPECPRMHENAPECIFFRGARHLFCLLHHLKSFRCIHLRFLVLFRALAQNDTLGFWLWRWWWGWRNSKNYLFGTFRGFSRVRSDAPLGAHLGPPGRPFWVPRRAQNVLKCMRFL